MSLTLQSPEIRVYYDRRRLLYQAHYDWEGVEYRTNCWSTKLQAEEQARAMIRSHFSRVIRERMEAAGQLTRQDFTRMNYRRLREHAKKARIPRYSRMDKIELWVALTERGYIRQDKEPASV